MVVTSNSLSTLCADIYPGRVSTASAASNLVRCLLGAVGAATVGDMLNAWGSGWTFVVTGLLVAVAMCLLFVEKRYGMMWRQKRWAKVEADQHSRQQGGQ